MPLEDIADQYFTYESRLASFKTAHQASKRRASNASTKSAKALKWPHRFLLPEELARAGFFYYPLQANPDNVTCFLCHRHLDGWEDDDDPLAEHLKHSPDCGWAVVATIEKEGENGDFEYPASARMIEARKATFAEKWPHEGKKGWKCKVKQLVDAGWKYTPTPESDDMATCTYCSLALDGWEPVDKPLDEHFKRSPECPFFTLINNHKQSPAAKRTKAKKDRTSKVSRLSTQSAFTVASEAPSMSEMPAEDEDSILTTATSATATRGKKGKAKKVAPARKTRAKKGEPVEVPAPEPEDDDFEVKVDIAPKPTRGRKRKSEEGAVELAVDVEAPAPKRRATRTRRSETVEDSIIHIEAPAPKGAGRKGRPSRKASNASVAPLRAPVPDDEEIDKALEADLERHLTDDESEPLPTLKKSIRASKAPKADHAMFGVEPMHIDEAAIEAELEAMEVASKPLPKAKGAKGKTARKVSAKQQAAAAKKAAEAEAEAQRLADQEAEAQRLAEAEAEQQIAAELEQSMSLQHSSPVIQPKKQRQSRQAPKKPAGRSTRGSAMSTVSDFPMAGAYHDSIDMENLDSGNETDDSIDSQSTVVRGSNRRGSTIKKGNGKAASRHIEEIVHKSLTADPVMETRDTTSVKSKQHLHVEEMSITEETYYTPAPEVIHEHVGEEGASESMNAKSAKPRDRPKKTSHPVEEPIAIADAEPEALEVDDEPIHLVKPTPKQVVASPVHRSPTPPPREMTPSQSPQSSDAENRPPSSKPSAATKKTVTPQSTTTRIPLAETTPMISPSKRNIIAGLKSDQPWTSVDLDTIFVKSPRDENGPVATLFGSAAEKVKTGDLTSPEKKMSVEEWIKHNAALAEEKLRSECERMVGTFEREGTRAMQALEGVEVLD